MKRHSINTPALRVGCVFGVQRDQQSGMFSQYLTQETDLLLDH